FYLRDRKEGKLVHEHIYVCYYGGKGDLQTGATREEAMRGIDTSCYCVYHPVEAEPPATAFVVQASHGQMIADLVHVNCQLQGSNSAWVQSPLIVDTGASVTHLTLDQLDACQSPTTGTREIDYGDSKKTTQHTHK